MDLDSVKNLCPNPDPRLPKIKLCTVTIGSTGTSWLSTGDSLHAMTRAVAPLLQKGPPICKMGLCGSRMMLQGSRVSFHGSKAQMWASPVWAFTAPGWSIIIQELPSMAPLWRCMARGWASVAKGRRGSVEVGYLRSELCGWIGRGVRFEPKQTETRSVSVFFAKKKSVWFGVSKPFRNEPKPKICVSEPTKTED